MIVREDLGAEQDDGGWNREAADDQGSRASGTVLATPASERMLSMPAMKSAIRMVHGLAEGGRMIAAVVDSSVTVVVGDELDG